MLNVFKFPHLTQFLTVAVEIPKKAATFSIFNTASLLLTIKFLLKIDIIYFIYSQVILPAFFSRCHCR
ncbi:hypothetical protein KKG29_02855, partial [Patescibacteria group bacterium]|nr:hypothetical protein [Patescibacteria group bacterium]